MLAEGSDTHLGARCREFESPHSDQMDEGRSIEQFSWTVQCPCPRFMGESLVISGFLFSHAQPGNQYRKDKRRRLCG